MKPQQSFLSTPNADAAISAEDRFKNITLQFYNSYIQHTVLRDLHDQAMTLQWPCFECKAEVEVNIETLLRTGRFNQSQLFCSKHQPTSGSIFRNHLFIRYEGSFYRFFKEHILNNTFKQYN